MTRFLRLLALPLLMLSVRAQAQTDFRPGYIVRPAGDTVRGEVDSRSAARNAVECRFRPVGGILREYAPTELLGYGLTGAQVYSARLVTVPDSAVLPPHSYFLEVLVAGATQLYYRRDSDGAEHYYLCTGSGPATELVQRRTLTALPDGSRILEKNLFRGTLAEQFGACPAVQQQVSALTFKRGPLMGIVRRYNTCMGGEATGPGQSSTAQRSHVTLGLVAGLGVSQLQFKGFTNLEEANFPKHKYFVGGLRLGFTVPRLSEKLSVQLEAFYQQQQYYADYTTSFGNSRPYREQARVELNYLKLPVLLRYTYPRGKVRPLVQLGVSPNVGLKVVAEYRQESGAGFSKWQDSFAPQAVTHFDWAPMAGVGAQTAGLGGRLLTLEARAERSTGFVYIGSIESHLWHYYVLFGVNLSK